CSRAQGGNDNKVNNAVVQRIRSATDQISSGSDQQQTTSVADQAADVEAVAHVLVALVDLFERVLPGDQFVELELAVVVHLEHAGNVVLGIGRPVERAADLLLHHRQHPDRAAELRVGRVADSGDDDFPALGDQVKGRADVVAFGDVGGDDERVRHLATGQQ